MQAAQSASTPLPANLRLSRKGGPYVGSLMYVMGVGSLMYAMFVTRSNIAHVVGFVSRFMHNLGQPHRNAMKHIFRYLVRTQDYDITFTSDQSSSLVVYTDSDYGHCIDNRKSMSG